MENVNTLSNFIWIFCDIEQTFPINNLNLQKNIFDAINNLRILDNSIKVIFSFISTQKIEFVNEIYEKYIGNKYNFIVKGPQIGDSNFIYNNEIFGFGNKTYLPKSTQIMYMINKYKNLQNLKQIYYIDDLPFCMPIVINSNKNFINKLEKNNIGFNIIAPVGKTMCDNINPIIKIYEQDTNNFFIEGLYKIIDEKQNKKQLKKIIKRGNE